MKKQQNTHNGPSATIERLNNTDGTETVNERSAERDKFTQAADEMKTQHNTTWWHCTEDDKGHSRKLKAIAKAVWQDTIQNTVTRKPTSSHTTLTAVGTRLENL